MAEHDSQGPTLETPEPAAAVAPATSPSVASSPAGRALIQRKIAQRRARQETEGGKEGGEPKAIQEAAQAGTAGAGEALPFRAQIQESFGRHDVGTIAAHTDGAAAAAARSMGAEAFASEGHVAFAGAPSLHTAAHEAAHVVQQRAGVQLKGGVGEAGDVFERHADAVADQVVAGRSAEALLDRFAGSGGGGGGVQRKVSSVYGDFDTTAYAPTGTAGAEDGVDIELHFKPNAKVDATKIGLTQVVKSVAAGNTITMDPSQTARAVPAGQAGEGSRVDRVSPYTNPLYPADMPGPKDKLGNTATVADWGQHGYHYLDAGKVKEADAILKDTPRLPGRGNNSKQVFESAALAVEGRQQGSYMGSVQWGWEVDGAGKYKKLDLTLQSKDIPSQGFMNAAKGWNAGTALGTLKTTGSPTNVYDATWGVAFTVAKDTTVTRIGPVLHNNEVYNEVNVVDGPQAGQSGYVKVADMQDQGDGAATLDLPIQWVGHLTVPPAQGRLATLREARSRSSNVLADLPVNTRVKVMDDSPAWVHVEVDTSQAGVVLNGRSSRGRDAAQMVRGFVSRELIARGEPGAP